MFVSVPFGVTIPSVTFGRFQDPLRDGSSLLLGSTHKSFPGPQGGIILSNDEKVFDQVTNNMVPGIVDNVHTYRIAALTMSLLEMGRFGRRYATKVVENARAMGRNLDRLGVKVKCPEFEYSASDQVHLDYILEECESLADRLEKANNVEQFMNLIKHTLYDGTSKLGAVLLKPDEFFDYCAECQSSRNSDRLK